MREIKRFGMNGYVVFVRCFEYISTYDFLTKTDGEKVNTYLINGLAKHLIEDVNDFFKDLSKKDAKE